MSTTAIPLPSSIQRSLSREAGRRVREAGRRDAELEREQAWLAATARELMRAVLSVELGPGDTVAFTFRTEPADAAPRLASELQAYIREHLDQLAPTELAMDRLKVVSLRWNDTDQYLPMLPSADAPAPPVQLDDGGALRVSGTRVCLERVLAAEREGCSAAEIAARFTTLAPADIAEAVQYARNNRAEVEAYLRRRQHESSVLREQIEQFQPQTGTRARLTARGRAAK